jgi:Domain of unknown function (DUF1707)
MMDTPGDKIAAGGGGRGHLRASRADREQVIDALKAAFVQGMLAKDEFDLRVGQTLASRTYAELAALTADLPAGLTDARPPEAARESVNKKAVAAVACATAVLAGMIVAGSPNSGLWFAGFIIVLLFAVPTGWLLLFHDWLDKRAGRRSARGLPGAGGELSQRPMSAGPARQLPSAGRDLGHTAEAAQSRLPRPPLPTLRRPCRGHARGRSYAIG